jgi:hypothetical protein
MAVEKFTLASLIDIDGGRIREAWEQALRRCRDDCHDRPGVAKGRKVTLHAILTPVCEPDGSLGSVDVSFEIDDSLPKRQSPSYNMRAARGGLLFNELSPDDINQRTLDEVGPRATEEADAS